MKVKVGDTVKIICGKDKGKEGKIIKTYKLEDKVVVEGLNMIKKHQKPGKANESGSIIDRESPIHVSNVKVVSSSKKNEKVKKEEPKKEKKVIKKSKGEEDE